MTGLELRGARVDVFGLCGSRRLRWVTPYNRRDAPAAVEFFREVNALDDTISAQTLLGWQEFVDEPENDGGSGFFTVWGTDKRLIALAYSQLEAALIRHFRIFVHPLHRRQGIARRLLAAVAELNPQHTLQTYCPERWRATAAFLNMAGFKAVDREDQLKRLPGLALHHGVQRIPIAHASPSDLEAICQIHELAYRGSIGFVPLYPATLHQRLTQSECELWVTRDSSAEVTAFLELKLGAEWEVNSVATSPLFRQHGLASALLQLACERASDQGRELRLFVHSSNDKARRLYQRLGFAPVSFSTRFVRGPET